MAKHPNRPKDSAALAKLVVDIASCEKPNDPFPFVGKEPDPAAVKRGKARAKHLTQERRSEIARSGAKAKWARKEK